MQYYLGCDAEEEAYALLHRVFIALIHHCKGGDRFAPVSEVIVKQYTEIIQDTDEKRICRILEVASIVCSVRQGTRMSR